MMRISARLIIAVGTLVALANCGRPSTTRPSWMLGSSCETLPVPDDPADSIKIVLLDAVEPEHAPWGQNASEQLVFHHLYETLITVDCVDEVRPGLASSWSSARSGWVWTFELREGARFWDGSPVTASDIVESWQDAMTLETNIDSVVAKDNRRIRVYLKQRQRDVPRELSAPVFALAKLEPGQRWPVGSGPYQLSKDSGKTIVLHPAFGRRYPVIEFYDRRLADERDALEGSIDMMVTSDRGVTEYAASRGEFTTIALPWERVFVLLVPDRVRAIEEGQRLRVLSADVTDGLARDAVRSDARGFTPPGWWAAADRCGEISSVEPAHAAPAAVRSPRIVYEETDPIARDLAERLVALIARDPATSTDASAVSLVFPDLPDSTHVTAVAMGAGGLARSLRMGDALAYVLALPRQTPFPCFEAEWLRSRAPWLDGTALGDVIVPLVDTRSHVIARPDRFGLITDFYGQTLIVCEK